MTPPVQLYEYRYPEHLPSLLIQGNGSLLSGYKNCRIKHLRSTGKCFRDEYATKLNEDGPSVSHGVF
jgi:hypothetical protein